MKCEWGTASLEWKVGYNIAPRQESVAVVQPAGAPRQIRGLQWEYIQSWAKDPAIGTQFINTRAETITTRRAFCVPQQERRCLILIDGFFDWESQGRRKQAWFIRMQDGHPIAFAGLWDRWTYPEGREVESCTIMTTTPKDVIRRSHRRMPVILVPSDYDLWLDVQIRDVDRLLPLLAPSPPRGNDGLPRGFPRQKLCLEFLGLPISRRET